MYNLIKTSTETDYDLRGFFCFKICDEIDHVTGAIFVVSF